MAEYIESETARGWAVRMMSEERGYLCDPSKHKGCSKEHCWLNGGRCKMTLHWEYATDDEQKKYPKEESRGSRNE